MQQNFSKGVKYDDHILKYDGDNGTVDCIKQKDNTIQ